MHDEVRELVGRMHSMRDSDSPSRVREMLQAFIKTNPGIKDFSRVTFDRLGLQDLILSGLNFEEAQFLGCNLHNSRLEQCRLHTTIFGLSIAADKSVVPTSCGQVRFTEAIAHDTIFRGDFQGAQSRQCFSTRCTF